MKIMNYASLGTTIFALLLFDKIYIVLFHHPKWTTSLQTKLKSAACLETLQYDVNRPSSMSSLRFLERCKVEEGTWMCWIDYANVSAFQEHLAVFLHIHWKHVGWQGGSTSTHLSYSHTTSLEKHPIRRKLIRSEQEIRRFPKPAPASPSHQSQGLLDFLWDGSVSTLLRSLPVCMILTGLSIMAHVRHSPPPSYLWMQPNISVDDNVVFQCWKVGHPCTIFVVRPQWKFHSYLLGTLQAIDIVHS